METCAAEWRSRRVVGLLKITELEDYGTAQDIAGRAVWNDAIEVAASFILVNLEVFC